MAKKSLNMTEKMMDPNIIDYYIVNRAIPSIITIENRYKIDFGKPDFKTVVCTMYHVTCGVYRVACTYKYIEKLICL